ncbi:alkaline phosphatase family protein [Streptomyces sp. F-7]|uniref:alkaline phosphatase family protein n=1 Tax=Streptomyces sp. F-7 TaxID=573566 RepID=UPI000AB170AD|nr:alkaline phosphatase family protein [Streptomyces sp. F-7]
MPEANRRRFLQLARATTAFSALSASIQRAAALPANHRTGSIEDVEHIVVLMQENRSFDHYFGTLRGVRGFGDPRPVTLGNGKPVWHQEKDGTELLPFHPDADDLGMQFLEGLPHSWPDGQQAYNGGRYDRWVPAKGTTTMAYLTREDIPFHFALADAFTVCDAYHCSFIGSTDPNRYYMWSGCTGNDGTGGGPVLDNAELGYGWTTYPERLEQAGISWKIYQDIGDGLDAAGSWGWIQDAYRGNYGDNSLLYFDTYRNAQPGDPWYDKARTGTDVKNGDGYFDHVVPPLPPKDTSRGLSTADVTPDLFPGDGRKAAGPYGLGPRVPMLVVSPWSKGGYVCSETLDHTSILQFMERRFGVRETNISPWRRAICGDLTAAFDFSRKDTRPALLPGTDTYEPQDRQRHPDYRPTPPADPRMPRQERGLRRSRPLKYAPHVDASVEAAAGTLTLTFASGPKAGAAFHVTSGNRTDGPWTYTTEAGRTLQDTWNSAYSAGSYDLTVHGPNGFVRVFKGSNSTAGCEVTARHRGDNIELTFTHTHTGTARLRIADGYGGRPSAVTVRPGETVRRTVDLTRSRRWYDLTVTADTDKAFLRRFAGHVENGQPGVSDPAIITA